MSIPSSTHTTVKKVAANSVAETDDILATEEPLEIRLEFSSHGKRITKSISVTMRTPGNDAELAVGFLYTEGIIKSAGDVTEVKVAGKNNANVVIVVLDSSVTPDVERLERNFYTTSSCGVCGKASIEAVRTTCEILDTKDHLRLPHHIIYGLPDILRQHQSIFEHTGGLHACALFDIEGKLVLTREDVGRHNALDKLIGTAFNNGLLPLNNHVLLLSGRASFELIQKSAMAGIKIVAAVGAPSSLAVQMAEDWGMTLIGFLRGERFNIYTGAQRVVI
jgi:FdhD protein